MANVFRSPTYTRIPRASANNDGLTWTQSLPLLLLSKDQFFTSAGRAPVFDWPNPRGKPFPNEGLTFIQSLDIGLLGKDKFFAAPGESPRYDYPNPRGKPNPIDGLTWLQGFSLNLRSRDQFFTSAGRGAVYDWSNPQQPRRGIDLYGFTVSSNQNLYTVVAPTPPPNQDDWPNPLIPRRAPEFSLSTNPNLYQSGMPFNLDDWPNPGRPRSHQYWIQSTSLTLLVPFNQDDWPNPLRPRRNPEFTLATNPAIYPSGKPFKQDDYPNPIAARQPAETRSFTLSTNPTLYPTGAAPIPFNQDDWPNPRAAAQCIDNRTWIESLSLLQLGKDQFFAAPGQAPRYDYPNPRGASRSIDLFGYTGAFNPNLATVVVVQAPFNQDDWQNPRAVGRSVQDWNWPTNPNLYRSGKPFLQTEWPNPTLPTVRRPDWSEATDLTRYPSGKPFKRDEWTNPLGPRRKPDLTNFLLPRNFTFYPPFVEQFVVQDTPTIANVIGVSNSAFLLLAAQSTDIHGTGLQTSSTLLSARSTRETIQNIKTKLIIFTANDKQVGD